MQDPDMKVVGAIFSPDQRASQFGAARIKGIGESLGVTVEVDSINTAPDLYHAVESLVDRGAEAIIIPIFTFDGFPLLMTLSNDYGIPVFFSSPPVAYRGGTVAGGFYGIYGQGVIAGQMLVGISAVILILPISPSLRAMTSVMPSISIPPTSKG